MPSFNKQKVLSMVLERGGYVRSKELRLAGVHPSILPALERSGSLVRVSRGLYAIPGHEKADDRLEILMSIPGSVLCLGSALSIHKIGTWEPLKIYLAVPAGRKVTVPPLMPVMLFHFSKSTFEVGIMEHAGHSGKLRVYNPERTLCDMFRLRHRLGNDLAVEALREYLKRKGRNIPRILEYAEKLNIQGPIKHSLEVLL